MFASFRDHPKSTAFLCGFLTQKDFLKPLHKSICIYMRRFVVYKYLWTWGKRFRKLRFKISPLINIKQEVANFLGDWHKRNHRNIFCLFTTSERVYNLRSFWCHYFTWFVIYISAKLFTSNILKVTIQISDNEP